MKPRLRDRRSFISAFVFGVAACTALWSIRDLAPSATYGFFAFLILGGKLLASMRHRPVKDSAPNADAVKVTVVVPFYNEDPTLLRRCLESVAAQTRKPDGLHVIDDGSSSPDARRVAEEVVRSLQEDFSVVLTVFQENLGKRRALATAFTEGDADIFLTVDSDTVLEPTALEEGLKPFSDPRVVGVTGMVRASNHDRNLLTRLLDVRYANAFLYERAAYSLAGSVLCACGTLALWRAAIVRAHVDDFLDQTFLGQPAVFGDDRRLTNYALQHGRVVLQETAVGYTAVPERLPHFVRQQVRWNKSFFRESLWAVQHLPMRSSAYLLSLLELTSWATFTGVLLFALLLRPFVAGPAMLGTYLGYLAVMAYARSVRYLEVRHDGQSRRQHASVFALAPLYGMLHLILLVPLRLYSLLTLGSGAWGTRDGGVEVRAQPSEA